MSNEKSAGQSPDDKKPAWRSLLALAGGMLLLIFLALVLIWIGSLVQ